MFDCVEIYPSMRCTMLYCYTVFSKILFFSWDLFSPQVQEWCCKSSGNHPQLAHSYRSRHDRLLHVVALSGCWKHLLLFESQKPWQIYHCLVFFANVSISNKLSINLLWFSQKLIPNLLPGQSLVLPCCRSPKRKLSSFLLVLQWQTLGCQTFLGKIFLSVFQRMGLGFILFALQISCHASFL